MSLRRHLLEDLLTSALAFAGACAGALLLHHDLIEGVRFGLIFVATRTLLMPLRFRHHRRGPDVTAPDADFDLIHYRPLGQRRRREG